MATRKPLTLDHLTPLKSGQNEAPAAAAPPAVVSRKGRRGQAEDGRIGLTLRLAPDAWKALKIQAAMEGVTAHDLLIEAVNLLFTKRGAPPIA